MGQKLYNLKGMEITYPIYYLAQPTNNLSSIPTTYGEVLFNYSPIQSFGVGLTRDPMSGYNLNLRFNPKQFIDVAAETATSAMLLKKAIFGLFA